MPKGSYRGAGLSHSPIRSLMPYAREAKARGKHVYHLNIGQPDIPTPPEALEWVRKLNEPVIRYGASEGLFTLREKVARYYDKFAAGLSMEDVFVTTGASEAILFTLLSCCDPGDEVIIPEPFYANYLGFAHMAGVRILPLTTTIDDGFQLPGPDAFADMISPRTKAIFLCNPGNPTGQLYSKAELEKLVELIRRHDLYLIVDEVYREFCYDEDFTSVLSFEGIEHNVIVIDSISKVFSACGARIGYLITKNKSVQEVVEKHAQLRLCPPYYGQKLAEGCYDNPNYYLEKAKQEYIDRRDLLFSELKNIPGLRHYKPVAAFYNMVELPVENAGHFCKWLLTDFEINNRTVMLAPGDGFYYHKEYGRKQVRIAYILKEEDLRNAVACLKHGLEEYRVVNRQASLTYL